MSILEHEIYTEKQGQYLAFIYYYAKINRVPPAHADFESWFRTAPSTVHQMILQLEKKKPDKAYSEHTQIYFYCHL
jgi:Mn-dependent DtxR family transcriptional regulator